MKPTSAGIIWSMLSQIYKYRCALLGAVHQNDFFIWCLLSLKPRVEVDCPSWVLPSSLLFNAEEAGLSLTRQGAYSRAHHYFLFHLLFLQTKTKSSHGWELCVTHRPQHEPRSQRSEELTQEDIVMLEEWIEFVWYFATGDLTSFTLDSLTIERKEIYIRATVLFTLFIKRCSSVASLNASSAAEIWR